ncbi:Pycsar system effector family protein [Kitasatospora purpeofusca]|uniref:Pycsar system effector family protein n=1 Tax=Kitasatospora purpeofusca TaxID=67352 RepID=UPI0037F6FE2D
MNDTASSTAIDRAWRIHGSLSDSIGRVDVKAAFALSLETAALVAITSAVRSMPTGPSPQWRHPALVVILWLSAVLVGSALLFAVAAVVPRIGANDSTDDWPSNTVYFGHLRRWPATELAESLTEQDLLPALSRQLVALSRIAWAKHTKVRTSLALGGIGVALAGLAAMMSSMT